jgi:hypothetical protein
MLMRNDKLQSIEDKLTEVAAKQDVLLDHILQLGRKLDGTTSEMKSNYVAIAAMFEDTCASPKA